MADDFTSVAWSDEAGPSTVVNTNPGNDNAGEDTREKPCGDQRDDVDKSRLEYVKGDRFGQEFTLKRAASLTRFLTRISHHPTLKKSRIFGTFLESDDWNTFRRNRGGVRPASAVDGVSVFDGISDTFLNAFSKPNVQSKELVDARERADKLSDNISAVEKTLLRVNRRQSDLVSDLQDFADQVLKLAALEPNLSSQFNELARCVHDLARGFYILKEQVDGDYAVSLRDMQNYIVSLKSLIKTREQKQIDYEALEDYLSKANVERELLLSGSGTNFLQKKVEDFRGIDHEKSRKERISKLDIRIHDLASEVKSAKATSESFEEFTTREVGIFENIKSLEMKNTLDGFVDAHIHFYADRIKEMEAIMATLGDD
jgi:sorting nexin-4